VGASLQPPLLIGIVGTLAGVLIAVFSAGLSRLPTWRHGGRFALVALTSAAYCAFDLAMMLNLSPGAIAFGVQAAVVMAVAHSIAWLWYLAALQDRPVDRLDRVVFVLGTIAGLIGLVPGTIITSHIVTIRVDWAGAVYQSPQPGPIGVAIYVCLALTMVCVAVRAVRRGDAPGRARLLSGLVALGVFGISDTFVAAGTLNMPMLLDAGSVVVVLVVGVASQRRLADDLTQAQQALARSERLASTGRLAAGIAHQINNPAAVIRHDLEQVLRGRGDKYQHIEHALASLDRIVNVVRRLLDLEPALRGGASALISFAVAPVVKRVAKRFQRRSTDSGISLSIESGLVAVGDPMRVEAVLTSLLSNAMRAVEGAPDGRVSIRASSRGDRTELIVADTGSGLPPEILSRLFEPFVHAMPQDQGVGLGLAVAYGLMRSQNGALRLIKTSPEGTAIALDLPRTGAPGGAAVGESDEAPDETLALSLLIIDDDPDLRLILKDAAETHGLSAVVAGTVEEAMQWLESGAVVDVVLCDLMMPDGGAELWLSRCREKYPLLAERTIIITGGATSPAAQAIVDAHTDRLLYKPFAMADIRTMAKRLMEQG